MFCHFCGKNFESVEGFEEVKHGLHQLIRCEKCSGEQSEDEYDWRSDNPAR